MITKYYHPTIHVISRPQVDLPPHLPVEWFGFRTDSGALTEFAGRLCYMSQKNPGQKLTHEYVENILKQGHGSVLEHANVTVLLEGISRTLTHEVVRHRAGFAYSQLSQRYVDESDVGFVVPPAIMNTDLEPRWEQAMAFALDSYRELVDELAAKYAHIEQTTERRKVAREAARSVLPNATETKLVMTGNGRSWRNFLEMRGGKGVERELRRMTCLLAPVLKQVMPEILQDIEVKEGADKLPHVTYTYRKV